MEKPFRIVAKPRVQTSRWCYMEGCGEPEKAIGLCSFHSNLYYRGKDLNTPRQRQTRVSKKLSAVRDRDALGHKQCHACGTWLPEGEFYKSSYASDGLSPTCRVCYRAARHGISQSDIAGMLEAQNWTCPICEDGLGKAWVVDHDHSCCDGGHGCASCVRALLCNHCNKAIGFLADHPGRLRRAAAYLESHGASGE